LQTGGAVRGMVVDGDGKPVRNFNVRVQIPRDLKPGEPAGGYYAGYDWYGISYTRDDGVFVLTGIGAGAWMRFLVSAPGVGYAVLNRVQSQPLDQLPPPESLAIRLKPFSPLTVQVVDAKSGIPIKSALVALVEDHPDFSRGFNWGYDDLWCERERTGDEGRAAFVGPVCEDGTLLVRAEGFARQRLTWIDRESELQVSLEPAAVLTGEVRLHGQLLAEGYAALVSAQKDHCTVDLHEGGGRFVFDELPAGSYTLEIRSRTSQTLHQVPIALEAGRTQKVNLGLPERELEDAPEK
jgi:hypothetical protein